MSSQGSVWLNEREITGRMEVRSGVRVVLLPRRVELGAADLVEPAPFYQPIENACEVKFPARFHECDQHRVFVEWQR